MEDAVVRNPARIKALSQKFIDELIDGLDQFKITGVKKGEFLDDITVKNIDNMLPLRDDYVKFIEIRIIRFLRRRRL